MIKIFIEETIYEKLNDFILIANDLKNGDDISKLNKYTENPEKLLNIISKLNKNHLLKLIKENNSNNIKKEIDDQEIYTKKEILKIFKNNNIENICKLYSNKQLSSMYYSIYLKKPSSSLKKSMIAESIKKYVNSINRMEGFKYLNQN